MLFGCRSTAPVDRGYVHRRDERTVNKVKMTGAMLATAVGVMFAVSPINADDASPAQVKCIGGNSCKGQSACETATNSCQGKNSCKGKGWIMTSSADECTKKGGSVSQ